MQHQHPASAFIHGSQHFSCAHRAPACSWVTPCPLALCMCDPAGRTHTGTLQVPSPSPAPWHEPTLHTYVTTNLHAKPGGAAVAAPVLYVPCAYQTGLPFLGCRSSCNACTQLVDPISFLGYLCTTSPRPEPPLPPIHRAPLDRPPTPILHSCGGGHMYTAGGRKLPVQLRTEAEASLPLERPRSHAAAHISSHFSAVESVARGSRFLPRFLILSRSRVGDPWVASGTASSGRTLQPMGITPGQ